MNKEKMSKLNVQYSGRALYEGEEYDVKQATLLKTK